MKRILQKAIARWFRMNLLKEGDKAPNFQLKDKDGKSHKLNDIKSDFAIIYFYPKDNTPGCTIEANMFNRHLESFKQANSTVIGISGGDEKSKTKFCNNHKLKLLLLSDTDFKVSESYGVYGEKKFMGRTYMGIGRVTYVLDKNKKIVKVYDKVKPATHASEVLKFVKGE